MLRPTASRKLPHLLAAAAALGAALLAGGCGTPAAIDTAASLRMVEPEAAFLLPDPGGPAVVSVTERHFANAVEQSIFLETDAHTPGQNAFSVQFFGSVNPQASGQTALRPGYLPIDNWRAEARGALPGIALKVSPYFVQNRYGPFGYAVGRGRGSDLCLFGWQGISAAGTSRGLWRNQGSIQVRLRFCRAGASEQSLLRLMYGFGISAFFRDVAWNPLGEPPAASVGRGSEIYPTGDLGFAAVVPAEPPRAAAPPPRRRRAPAPAAPRATELPAPVGPTVPPPPDATAAVPVPAAEPATAAVPAPSPAPALSVRVPPPP